MQKITLGKYVPNNTIVHKIDPRCKVFVLLALLVSIFFKISYVQYGILIISIVAMLIISKTSIKSVLGTLKHIWLMMLILLIINIFVIKGDGTTEPLFVLWGIEVYLEALISTLTVILRLFMMISLTTILTATTKPLELTSAIEWYFSPLKIIKFPAHEIAMTISIALRFIPTLLEETDKIMKAQASRGMDIQNGKMKEKINGVISLIIPLFISSFQKSEELANAMEARGYNPTGKRTRYRQLKFHWIDLFTLIIIGGLTFVIIYSTYHPEIFNFITQLWTN